MRVLRALRAFPALTLILLACSGDKVLVTAPPISPVARSSSGGVNVAAAANGATVIASSSYSSAYAPSGAINGDRAGANWGTSGGWNDGTAGTYPDWLEVNFAASQTIDEVDVFTVQDNYASPSAPTLSQTFSQYGLTDFRIEMWDGAAWVVVPNGVVTGNTLVWRQVTFTPVTTTKIRLWVTGSLNTYSRVAEIEAYTVTASLPGAFSKTSPTTGTTFSPGAVTLTWPASPGATSYEYCVDGSNNATCDATWVSTTALSATLTTLSASTTYYWQVRARNATGTTDANAGTWWSFSLTSSGTRVNVAAAANGATVIASSSYSSAYAPSGAINGDRAGANWGTSGGWNDGTAGTYPDWLEVNFAASQTIDEVDVFTVQDNYASPSAPTLSQTFSQYGLTDFRIEMWDGAAWVVVPNGVVTGNTLVWRQVTFTPVTTTKIRLWVTGSLNTYSRVAEIEAYTAVPASQNLRIENVYLTQATQRPDGTVSMVAGRDALLRVFVTANIANSVRPDVRVRIYDGLTLLQTVTIPAQEASVRTTSAEGVLTSTWNMIVPAVNMRPTLRVVADVDPTAAIAETDRSDNVWPRGGSPAAISVTTVPTFSVRFVPVTVLGVTGVVSEANKEQFLTSTRRFMPISTIVSDVRAPFTSSANVLQSDDANSAWLTVLSEMNALRAVDGAASTLHYYGVVRTSYTSGVAGYGYVPGRAAIGWDYLPSGDGVAVHEWGHNFSRPHTPCGVSGDAAYPYAGGAIGMWGWNSASNALVSPTSADFMGYCSPKWISDWTWSKVMAYRQAQGFVTSIGGAADQAQEGLLVWGRIVDGRVQLAPAFRVRAPITPTAMLGSHRVQLLEANGATLLDVPVNADRVDHELAHDERQFAVVLPWSAALEQSLARVRVSDVRQPLLAMERVSSSLGARNPSAASGGVAPVPPEPQSTVSSADASHTRIRWNARDYPMAMVRDATTGTLMGFLRNADAIVTTNGRRIEVVYSDGVRSVVRR